MKKIWVSGFVILLLSFPFPWVFSALVLNNPASPDSSRVLGINLIFGKSESEMEYLAGYLIIPVEKVDKSYNAGFSMYVPA